MSVSVVHRRPFHPASRCRSGRRLMSHLPRCWLIATLVAPRFKQATLNRSKDPNKISKLTADYIPVRAKFLVYLRPSFRRTSSYVCIFAHVSE